MAVGAIDDDGVAQRNIQSVFDDRRSNEDVGLVAHEVEHDLLQFAFAHLSVADDDARLRHQLAASSRAIS